MRLKQALLLAVMASLTACKSTTIPKWYLNPVTTNSSELVAVGQGWTLEQAKQKALSAINQQLWTQVNSSSNSRNIANDVNGDEFVQQFNDISVKTKTASLVLNGVQFSQTDKSGDTFFVQASIAKSKIKNQLISDINRTNEKAKFALKNLNNTDPLLWWVKNKNTKALEEVIVTRASVLSALNGSTYQLNQNYVSRLQAKIKSEHSKIVVLISAKRNDKWMTKFVTNIFNQYQVQVVTNPKQKYSHRLNLNTVWSQKHIADMYISTVKVNLELIDKKSITLASNEIIANANSVTSFVRAKEGASRSFSAKLKEQNLWKAIGL